MDFREATDELDQKASCFCIARRPLRAHDGGPPRRANHPMMNMITYTQDMGNGRTKSYTIPFGYTDDIVRNSVAKCERDHLDFYLVRNLAPVCPISLTLLIRDDGIAIPWRAEWSAVLSTEINTHWHFAGDVWPDRRPTLEQAITLKRIFLGAPVVPYRLDGTLSRSVLLWTFWGRTVEEVYREHGMLVP
jgi:hypothetical protein